MGDLWRRLLTRLRPRRGRVVPGRHSSGEVRYATGRASEPRHCAEARAADTNVLPVVDDGMRCEPVVDGAGKVVATARVSPHITAAGRAALAELVAAARAEAEKGGPEQARHPGGGR